MNQTGKIRINNLVGQIKSILMSAGDRWQTCALIRMQVVMSPEDDARDGGSVVSRRLYDLFRSGQIERRKIGKSLEFRCLKLEDLK